MRWGQWHIWVMSGMNEDWLPLIANALLLTTLKNRPPSFAAATYRWSQWSLPVSHPQRCISSNLQFSVFAVFGAAHKMFYLINCNKQFSRFSTISIINSFTKKTKDVEFLEQSLGK